MPNGGSDCCGTCPFNRKNSGEVGYSHAHDAGPNHCEIRDLAIENSFYTYCANHPHHNPAQTRVPIGPVFVHDHETEGRRIWQSSPDTEEVRMGLLRIIAAATGNPPPEYFAGLTLTEAALLQIREFREARAVPELERIRQFTEPPAAAQAHPFARSAKRLARGAARALEAILPPDQIAPHCNQTVRAIAATIDQSSDRAGLAILADALQEAGCTHSATLGYLRGPDTRMPNWVVDVILGRVVAEPT